MPDQNNDQIPASVIKNGGVDFTVKKLDGTTEEVSIRLIPVRQVEKYYEKIFDISSFVEFVTGKPQGWADNLWDDSLYAVDKVAKEINDPRFDRLLERQVVTVETKKPILERASGLTNSLRTP